MIVIIEDGLSGLSSLKNKDLYGARHMFDGILLRSWTELYVIVDDYDDELGTSYDFIMIIIETSL